MMALSRSISISLLTLGLVLGACVTERPRERIGVTTQALASGDLHGWSLPAKTLALTFDDGPGDRAAELSSYLAGQGIRAAFFVNGDRIATSTLPNPNGITQTANASTILARIVADGHLVGNHTVTHRDLVAEVLPTGASLLARELAETDADIAAYVPSNHFLFRAPYGSYSSAVYDALRGTPMDNKYIGPVNWEMGNVSTNYPAQAADWACWQNKLQANGAGPQFGVTTQQCGDAYLTEINAVGRGIILMHDPYFSAIGSTVDMIKYIVPILKANGYSFVRVDEVPDIAALLGPSCAPGCATCTPSGACASCNGGSYLGAGACHACSACAAGSYVAAGCATNADTSCAPCAPSCATCSAAGADHCSSCSGGSYLGAGACHPCSTCSPGRYTSATCTDSTDASCAPCSAGTFSGAGASTCTPCAPGTHAPTAGAASCDPCPGGTFASESGATSCTKCAAGSYSGPGATACGGCEACDDADPCTMDTCDDAKGCVHTLVPACGSDGGASGGESRGTSAAASTPGGSGNTASALEEVDAGTPPEPTAVGCALARPHSGGGESAAIAIGLFGLALARRQRNVTGSRAGRAREGTSRARPSLRP